MTKIALLIVMILLSTNALLAQADKAVELDDFSQTNSEVLESRLDSVGTILLNNPGASLQIMIYRGESDSLGSPYRMAAVMKNYLNDYRRISNDISVTHCETGKEERVRIWLLPAGASPQICSPPSPNVFTATRLFDAFYNFDYGECCRVNEFSEAEGTASLSALALELKKNLESRTYVYLYEGNLKGISDKSSLIKKWSRKTIKTLTENGIEPSRITVKYGGRRANSKTMEVWFVPKGGEIPKPKPDYFPKKKRRKKK